MRAMDDVLAECGVTSTTLIPAEREVLDQLGFVVLGGVVDRPWLERLQRAFEAAASAPPKPGGREESGTRHPKDLIGADPVFAGALTHPRVLAAVHHVLRRPFQVLLLSGRDPLPGYGQQGLHTDWTPRAPHEAYAVVTALWLLDDFTADNGATRVVPGSHLVPRPLPKSLQQPDARHPAQQLVLAPAGSVLVFNGHLCHSGMRNTSDGPRRALQCQWVARDRARPAGADRILPDHLGPAERALLGA